MKIQIKKNTFLKYLKFCNYIIEENAINPILSSVLIKFKKEKIEYICSNKKTNVIFIQENDYKLEEEFEILIKIKQLINLLSKINSNEIELFTSDENTITIIADKFVANLNVINKIFYPIEGIKIEDKQKINLSKEIVNKVLKKVGYVSYNSNECVKIICGINFDFKKDEIIFDATDSFRVSRMIEKIKNNESFSFVVETKVLEKVMNIFEEKEEIEFFGNKENLILKTKNKIIQLNLLEGSFPSIDRFFEFPKNIKFFINRSEMLSALERAAIIIDNEKLPSIDLIIKEQSIIIDVSYSEYGNSTEEIPIKKEGDQELRIKLNCNFLINILKNFEEEKIIFWITSNDKPIVIYQENNEYFKQLVLPIVF